MPQGIARDLDAWLDTRPPCEHDRLFCSRQASPLGPKAIYRMMDRLSEAARLDGKHLHPHMLRHTAATMALRNSGDLLATQHLLGHSDPSVTRVYCHLTTADVRRTVATNPLSSSGPTAPHSCSDDWCLTDEERAWIEELDDLLAARIEEYDALLDASSDLCECWRRYWIADWCRCAVPGTERMSLHDALRIAWEDEVVEGYSMGCHTQIVRLRDVLAEVAASPRLPHDLPAWLSDLHERMGWRRAAPRPEVPARLRDLLAHDATAAMRPLERAARLQAAVRGEAKDTSAMAIAADVLATCALSRRHALPLYRRVAPGATCVAAPPARSGICGHAPAMAERALCATQEAQVLGALHLDLLD
ncbi:MAG: tyrosine-type recombinase/integrase [Armatimonadota bacterium]